MAINLSWPACESLLHIAQPFELSCGTRENLESDKKRSSLLVYDVFVWLRVKGLAARAVDLGRQELSKPAKATLLTTVLLIASEISVCLQGSDCTVHRSLSISVSLSQSRRRWSCAVIKIFTSSSLVQLSSIPLYC
jgi:hypothetical protein